MLNKCDVLSNVPKDLFYKALEIERIQKLVGKVYLKETSAYTKDGLEESFDWMAKNFHVDG